MDLNHLTGGAVDGWAEVTQSIETILATRLNTRVFARNFGSDVPLMVDMPMNDAGILALYRAVAEAIERFEPRFELTGVNVTADASGGMSLQLNGNYIPNAHRGDSTVVSDGAQTVRVERGRVDNWRLAA